MAAAREALARRRVLGVWGLAGIGKSAFVRALLDEATRASTVEVRARAGEGLGELADAAGVGRALPRDDAGIAAVLFDRLAELGLTLVVDDAHELEPKAQVELLHSFARHATSAALLVTTRVKPDVPDLAEQLVHLDGLDADDMRALIRGCRPDVDGEEEDRIVARSAGSPWLGRCLATGARASSDHLASSLAPELQTALDVLRFIDLPIQVELVDRIAGRTGAAGQLVARAFAERLGRDLRMHDVAREHLAMMGPPERSTATRALGIASEGGRLEHFVVALALAAALDDRDAIQRVLDRQGGRLLARGLAAQAWRALASLPGDVATTFRLACAAEAGTRVAIDWAARLEPPLDPDAVVFWSRCLDACGRGGDARGALSRVAAEAAPAQVLAAAEVLCRLARSERDALDAYAILGRPGVSESGPPALGLALQARSLVYAGRPDEAVRLAVDATRELDPYHARAGHIGLLLFKLFVNLGRYANASGVLRRVPGLFDKTALSPSELYGAALHALETGDLTTARVRMDRMARSQIHDAPQFLLDFLRFRLASVSGDGDGARRAARAIQRAAGIMRHPEMVLWARVTAIQLAALEDVPAPPWSWPSDVERHGGPSAVALEVHERLGRARRGEDERSDDLDIPDAAIELRCFHARLVATCQAGRGDVAAALRTYEDAVALAREHEARLLELELLEAEAGHAATCDDAVRTRVGSALEAVGVELGLASVAERGRSLAGRAPAPARAVSSRLSLDPVDRMVHLPDGRAVSLADHDLGFRILEEILGAGGRTTKARLATTVWARKRYDPSRDDKRLQMAIRRLRVLLEADPSRPTLLLTTPDGYALAADGRRSS